MSDPSPDTVPAHLVERLDRIFADVPGVDTVELGALLKELTGNSGLPNWQPMLPTGSRGKAWRELTQGERNQVAVKYPTFTPIDRESLKWEVV